MSKTIIEAHPGDLSKQYNSIKNCGYYDLIRERKYLDRLRSVRFDYVLLQDRTKSPQEIRQEFELDLWIGVPYSMLLCSGILMNIPEDLYESARIDGTGPVRRFMKITLPYMLFVTGPYLITQFIGNLNNFNVIYLLSGGGPGDLSLYTNGAKGTDLLITWLYKLSLGADRNYKLASVIGILVFIISALMSLIVYNRSSAVKGEEHFQ